MTLTLALNSAISGLSTAQAGLDTVAHNIANVNTEGFTRQDPRSVLARTGRHRRRRVCGRHPQSSRPEPA